MYKTKITKNSILNKLASAFTFRNKFSGDASLYIKRNEGFTLIELLLVVVLIGVLSGLVISAINVNALRARSRNAQRSSDLKKIQTALELYFSDNRGYPASGSFQNIASVLATPLVGPYISVLPIDPRDNETMPAAACTQTVYRYFYRTDVGAGLASRYVLYTFMENNSDAATSLCNALPNCAGATPSVAGCSCGGTCYGVQNPL